MCFRALLYAVFHSIRIGFEGSKLKIVDQKASDGRVSQSGFQFLRWLSEALAGQCCCGADDGAVRARLAPEGEVRRAEDPGPGPNGVHFFELGKVDGTTPRDVCWLNPRCQWSCPELRRGTAGKAARTSPRTTWPPGPSPSPRRPRRKRHRGRTRAARIPHLHRGTALVREKCCQLRSLVA